MRLILFTIPCLLFSVSLWAQDTPPLERKISITITDAAVTDILDSLAGRAGVTFSYNAAIKPIQGKASLDVKEKPLREVLEILFRSSVDYRQKGSYIILSGARQKGSSITVSGYVYNNETDETVANASVYDAGSLSSSLSDEYGYYQLKVPARQVESLQLRVEKVSYRDTIVQPDSASTFVSVNLSPGADSLQDDQVTMKQLLKDAGSLTGRWFRNFKGYFHTINISDTLRRSFQFSLAPYVGTNHKLSGKIINRFSLNLTGGYSEGNTGLEIGGAFNVNRRMMYGSQFAGAFNATGDTMRGAQFAGAMNMTGAHATGFQAAGGVNINSGKFYGFQAAGGVNINGDDAIGVSVAGGANLQDGAMLGMQIAGGYNLAGNVNGMQIAGGMNQADTVRGMQIAGGVNYARHLAGVQLGVVNIAESATGIPIGVFSYVKNGRHQLELSADESFYQNIAFRSGVRGFYNIITAGANLHETGPLLWHFGYGVGLGAPLGKKWTLEVDFSSHHVNKGDFTSTLSEMMKVSLGLEFSPVKGLTIAAGPVINGYLYDYDNRFMDLGFLPSGNHPGLFMPYHHYSRRIDNELNFAGWAGAKVALRFF